jgi:PadR family transcriptional regulator, regulatory protein PadR
MGTPKSDLVAGTLALMILKTLETVGSLHGYAIARRIEQISGNQIALNQGTIYPALLRLEQEGWISPTWGESETGRRVKFYAITRSGKKQLHAEQADWERAAGIVARFVTLSEEKA